MESSGPQNTSRSKETLINRASDCGDDHGVTILGCVTNFVRFSVTSPIPQDKQLVLNLPVPKFDKD